MTDKVKKDAEPNPDDKLVEPEERIAGQLLNAAGEAIEGTPMVTPKGNVVAVQADGTVTKTTQDVTPPGTTPTVVAGDVPNTAPIQPPPYDELYSGVLVADDDPVVWKYVGKGRTLSNVPPRELHKSEVKRRWGTKARRDKVLAMQPPIYEAVWEKDDLGDTEAPKREGK